MKEMIFESSQAKILLSQSDNQEIRAFIKNIGSNFILKDKKFQFALKIGWRALAEGDPTKTFPNWRDIVNDVRTIIQNTPGYIHIPDLQPQVDLCFAD